MHIFAMIEVNHRWLIHNEDDLAQRMKQKCMMYDGTDHKCDIESVVNNLVPLVYIARLVYLVIGVILAILPFWKLDCAKVMYYYWLMRDILMIERPFQGDD